MTSGRKVGCVRPGLLFFGKDTTAISHSHFFKDRFASGALKIRDFGAGGCNSGRVSDC